VSLSERVDRREKPIECRCPKCKSLHFMRIRWYGRGVPWKYCKACYWILFGPKEHDIMDKPERNKQ